MEFNVETVSFTVVLILDPVLLSVPVRGSMNVLITTKITTNASAVMKIYSIEA